MIVLDASAVLAWLQDETGATSVDEALEDGGCFMSAANWSEVAQKTWQRAGVWEPAEALLKSYDLVIEPVSETDATWAARKWLEASSLSLADRLCLALGARLGVVVLTADQNWTQSTGKVRQIR